MNSRIRFFFYLNPVYVAAHSLRSLRSNKYAYNTLFVIFIVLKTKEILEVDH